MSTIADQDVSFSLELNVSPQTLRSVRQLETILYRALGLLRRMGVSEEIDEAIAEIQRLITVVNSLRLALISLQTLRMAAGDPLAWATFIISAGTVAFNITDFATEVSNR